MNRRRGISLLLGVLAVLFMGTGKAPEGPEPLPEGGYDHARAGGIVNIRLVDNRFEIHFLDKDRIPQPVAYDKATVFYEQTSNRNNKGNILLEATPDRMKLVAVRPVRPPPLYFARVVFLRDGEPAESIARFDLR